MKKLLTILFAASLLSACQTKSKQTDEVTLVIESPDAKYKNAYYIDSPHALDGYYYENTTPEIYAVVATRAVNRMLDETKAKYETLRSPLLYIMEPKKGEDAANGFYLSQIVTKKIIEGSRTYTVVNNIKDADYYLETLITKVSFEDSKSPIIQYKLTMYDRTDAKIGEWLESIRKVTNDDGSWL